MLKHALYWSGLVMLAACGDKDTDPTTTDLDGDGFVAADDCDDSNATAYPGADEVCDGVDNDCDGVADDEPTDGQIFYVDGDGDGSGSTTEIIACAAGDGVAEAADDCDDIDATAYPGADEVCDNKDNNCDGSVDEGLLQLYYLDLDQDGYGDPESTKEACDTPTGYVDNDLDCDDRSADVGPDNPWYPDADEDGYGSDADVVASCEQPEGYIAAGGDCDDTDTRTFPGAAADVDSALCSTDADEDGFGDSSPPKGVEPGTDCDDSSAQIYPGAVEEDKALCMVDADGDGFGDSSPPKGVDAGTDCDDATYEINPDADEVCDGVDNNCDAVTDDDAVDRETFYADSDGDGYGDSAVSALACRNASGYTPNGTDCDDSDAEINPGEYEDCTDGIDNDCDGVADDVCAYAASDADVEITGTNNSYTGISVASGGDVDGDGTLDLMVGTQLSSGSGASRTYGKVFLYFGSVSSGSYALTDADVDVVGSGSDYLGQSADLSGDFDGDGYDDIAVGAPYGNSNRGAVYVHAGPVTSGASLTAADATADVSGAGTYTYLGQYSTVARDVDGDGDEELIASAIYGASYRGEIYVFDDPSGSLSTTDAIATVTGSSTYSYAGYSSDMLPDTDGDGYDELIYGEAGSNRAYMLAGPISGSLTSSSAAASFAAAGTAYAGRSVAGGDFNGDGYGDVAVAAPYMASYRGTVQVFYGPVSGAMTLGSDEDASIAGSTSYGYLGEGQQPLSAGDVNADGTDDLLIGQYSYGSSKGASFLFYGNMSGALTVTDADVSIYGSASGGNLGSSNLLSDVDGDGYDDVVSGAPYVGRAGNGTVYVFLGSGF